MFEEAKLRDMAKRLFLWPFALAFAAVSVAGTAWLPKIWMITHPVEAYRLMSSHPTPLSAYPEGIVSSLLVEQASEWGLVWMHQTHFHEVLSITVLLALLSSPVLIWGMETESEEAAGSA